LIGAGATPAEAEDLLSQLWVDCVVGDAHKKPLLSRYNGLSPLRAWLKAIAMNRWISLKRAQTVHMRAIEQLAPATGTANDRPDAVHSLEIRSLLAPAIRRGLDACASEDLILLQLIHVHKLTRREVAVVWGWDESKMSRRLRDASNRISTLAMEHVKKADPNLDITWTDLLDLCEAQSILWG
jgi:DNA-directed RNA polymerase specialized sigma24 family protein